MKNYIFKALFVLLISLVSYSEAKDLPNVSLGIKKKRDIDGMVMVFVPSGSFKMGCTKEQMEQALRLCSEVQMDKRNGDPWAAIRELEKLRQLPLFTSLLS